MLPCVSLQCSFPGQLILERERTWIYVTAGCDGIFCTVQIAQSFSLSYFIFFFLHTDLSIKEMKNLLYHGGIYITMLQLQHILMGKRHDAVPNETRWFSSPACLGVAQENPLGFNTAAGQLFFPGRSLVVPYRWRTSLLPLDIFHTDADVCFKKPSC